MLNENIFRTHRKQIEQRFIGSFSAKFFNPEHYVKASIPFKWIPRGKHTSIKRIEKGDYEETLINILETPYTDLENGMIVIIVGGIGTGKSTTIRYALNNANLCKGCKLETECEHDYPQRILIDFLIKPEIERYRPVSSSVSSEKPTLTIDEFWFHIIQVLDNSIMGKLDLETEISLFWEWLFKSSRKFVSYHLYTILFPKIELFKKHKENSKELIMLRDEIYKTFSQQEIANYRLLQLAYLREEHKENCNILVFDNIDSIEPYLQLRTLEFAIKACHVLKSKAIIPMRPHTFSLNNLAGDFIEVIEHWVPDLSQVIQKRIDVFSKNCSPCDKLPQLLNDLNQKINSSSVMREIFQSSSGGSIRYSLRNFYNLMLSHLILTNKITGMIEEIPHHIFYQAYFCSETKDQTMYELNFVNLYSLSINYKNPIYSTIKLRLLHMIYTYNVMNLIEITNELVHFGYSPNQIVIAINDLLNNRKALLWSNSANSYDENDLYTSDWVSITPLGIDYYTRLLHYTGYLSECIVKVDENRIYNLSHTLRRLVEVLGILENEDYKETITYISNTPTSDYLKFYHKSDTSITSILWSKLASGLKTQASYQSDFILDHLHEEFIKRNIKSIIEKQEYPKNLY